MVYHEISYKSAINPIKLPLNHPFLWVNSPGFRLRGGRISSPFFSHHSVSASGHEKGQAGDHTNDQQQHQQRQERILGFFVVSGNAVMVMVVMMVMVMMVMVMVMVVMVMVVMVMMVMVVMMIIKT